MKTRYFYLLSNEKICGPFPASTLDSMYRSFALSGKVMISADKIHWFPLEDVLYHQEEYELISSPESKAQEPYQRNKVETDRLEKNQVEEISLKPFSSENNSSDNEEPENNSSDSGEPENDTAEVSTRYQTAGRTLHFLWNTPDVLQALLKTPQEQIFRVMLPMCFLFPLILNIGAACSIAYFFGELGKRLFLLLSVVFISDLFTCMEFLYLSGRIENCQQNNVLTSILTGMLWITSGTMLCIIALYHGLTILPESGRVRSWALWVSGIFTFVSGCFFCANLCAGLKEGLERFYGFRASKTVWISALFLVQLLGAFVLVWCLAK